jgi:cobalt transporter subunit CbtB
MTTLTQTLTSPQAQVRANTDFTTIAAVAFLGLALIFVTGFARASVIHDAAHDVRHSIGFACH